MLHEDGRALEPLDPKLTVSLRDHVHRALRLAIISGRFAYQSRLNERQLAEELGVSTTPLKEALRQLEADGLVTTLPRRGVVVLYGRTWAEEMILARAALEAMISRMAAQRLSKDDAEQLESLIERMTVASSGDDPDELIEANEAFHDQIHKSSACVYLGRLIDRQRFYDASTRRIIHSDLTERAKALAEHTQIGRAIIARDPDAAEQAMRNHVMRSGELYIRRVFGNSETPMGGLDPLTQ
ncbi:GntR family transcriptional regulator [Devosia nitrariae]|uniref:GntR family transcriptional regulator n=1 Tax=Devosia nitrariae TaxID=2071872 RepID=A0ABQ5W6D5_9HYPH|nr:GntR family transcriptional regulator [Devosia nitrariae]GLQ55414.1 GntR family transcriptional regulator [Devosia nitrariae]